MAITRWDPFRDVLALQHRMNSLLQDFPRRAQNEDELLTTPGFAPPVDIYEDDHQLTLKLETPGIREEDLKVQVENNTLTVQGERKFDKEEKEENFRRVEHHYGSFYRAFTLPNTVDPSDVKAEYQNGVLRLTFAKRAEAKPRQIKVTAATTGKQVESAKPEKTAEKKTAA